MRTILYLGALSFAAVTAFSVPATATFNKEIVDDLDEVNHLDNRLVLDGSDTPHMLYLVKRPPCPPWSLMYLLRYATKSDGSWVVEDVPHETCNPHFDVAIACAPDGTVRILFQVDHFGAPTTSDLVYGVRDQLGIWSFETIETNDRGYLDPRIAVDPEGVPHVSYGSAAESALKYGVRTGSGWAVEIVDDTDDSGGYVDLALDSSGSASISYFAYATQEIRFARQTISGWNIEVVDSSISLFGCTSLQFDPRGVPHLAYALRFGGMVYATKPLGTWEITSVPIAEGYTTAEVELALDNQSVPHILFPGRTVWDLNYVFLSNGQWVHLKVDEGQVGSHTSIVLDSQDVTHIAYFDDDNDDVMYATAVSASGVPDDEPEWVTTNGVSLHPNPSRGDLRVVFESEMGQSNPGILGRFVADVVDSQGRRRTTLTPTSIESNSIGFELPRGVDLSAGLYVLQLRGPGPRVAPQKWIYVP